MVLLLIGAALCGGALYCSTFMYTAMGQALMYAVAGLGGALLALALLGLFAVCTTRVKTSLLTFYFTALIFVAFAMLVGGGFCFILNTSAVEYLEANWDKIVASLPPEKRASVTLESLSSNIRFALFGLGGGSLIVFLICLSAMSNAVALLTATKAYTLFLQATNIALLPIGIALIAAASYVADTAVAAEAAAAAFAIFILGTFVIVLLLLGCVGTSLQSRGIVRLFMFLTTLLSLAFLAFGILSLVQSNLVSSFITSQWETFRRVLPPDFAGRYDKEIFTRFLNANLTALGFLSLCAGVVLISQSFASYRLRSELKFESELEQEAWEAVKHNLLSADVAETISKSNSKSKAQVMWKQQWTKGTKMSRRLILCGCCTLCTAVTLAVGIASAALFYSTSCTTMGKFSDTKVYSETDLGQYVFLHNNYSLGVSHLVVTTTATAVTVSLTKGAFKDTMAEMAWPAIQARNYTLTATDRDPLGSGVGSNVTAWGIDAVERAKTEILGYDISCQNTDMSVRVPTAALYTSGGGNSRADGDAYPFAVSMVSTRGSSGIDIDWSAVPYPQRLRIRYMSLLTSVGSINVDSVLVGSAGLAATTTLGELSLVNSEARCDPGDIGTGRGGIALATEKGSLTVRGLNALDCDVTLSVTQSLANVDGSLVTNSLGGGTLTLVGAQGMMQVLNTRADVLDIKGDAGTIHVDNTTVSEALKVASRTGGVSLERILMSSRAVLQVESDSGDISVWATRFRGIISVVTGGTIQCVTNANDGFDDTTPCVVTAGGTVDSSGAQTLRIVEQVSVNCKTPARNDCPYLGHITITSTTGNVILRMDKVTV